MAYFSYLKLLVNLVRCLIRNRTEPKKNFGGGAKPDALAYPHDTIKFFVETKDRIFSECIEFYKNGLSLREIESRTGVAKSTIRHMLIDRGFVLRNFTSGLITKLQRTQGNRPGARPYGYGWTATLLWTRKSLLLSAK